jgi:hypothetical protein
MRTLALTKSLPWLKIEELRKVPWSLGFAVGMTIFFSLHPEWHGDLNAFRENAEELWHPYWARWLFSLLKFPPEPVAFIGLSLASTVMLYLAVRIFGGKHWQVFTSFAFAWTLFYGQIDGLVIGGLLLAWWACVQKRPVLIGAGIMLALIKPQLSLPMVVALWYWSPSRLKALILPILVMVGTLLQWGWWIPEWISKVFDTQYLITLSRNISLWPVLGPWVWLVWPFVLWVRMPRDKKLLAIAVTTAMTAPYFPLPSAVLLLTFPVPVWVWGLVQIPLFGSVVGYWVYRLGLILPPALLSWILWPEVKPVLWRLVDRMAPSRIVRR